MRNLRLWKILLISLIINLTFLSGQSFPFALDIKRHVLPNGLTLLHVERHNLPIITVTLLIKAGPFYEPAQKAGLANLTAELLTEGTKKRKAKDISEEIEFIGASLDSSAGSDFSTINLSVLKKDIDTGFEIFSDILLNPTFPEEEIKRKKDIIIGNLRRSEEDPSFVVDKVFRKEVYGDHPYGRLITGTEETISRINREDIIKFHHDYYRPNNAILSIVGDITSEELQNLIGKYLAKWEMSSIPAEPKVSEVAKGKQVIQIDKDLTQANIIIGHRGIKREDPDYYAVTVMNYILGGGGFSSRLMQTIRDEMGLAYDIHSFFDSRKKGGLFSINVQTKNETANTVIEEILKELKRIKTEPVSDQELDDAKAYLTGSFTRRFDTNKKISDMLVAVEYFNLGLDYLEKYPEYIKSVTKDDIIRVAKKYLDTDNYTLVVVAKQSVAKIKDR
ncbi:MAG: M16 family metallopeptidase [Thermodesulfovibrionales bacterium]